MPKKHLTSFIFVCVLWLPANAFAQYEGVYKYFMRLGHQALEEKNYAAAYDYFNHAYLSNPDSKQAQYYLEKLQELNSQREEENHAEYQTATEGYPGIFDDYMRWGKKALREHDYKEALALFEYASIVNSSSDEPLFYINLIKRLKDKRLKRAVPAVSLRATAGSEAIFPDRLLPRSAASAAKRRGGRRSAPRSDISEHITICSSSKTAFNFSSNYTPVKSAFADE